MAIINPQEKKLTNRTSVNWGDPWPMIIAVSHYLRKAVIEGMGSFKNYVDQFLSYFDPS